MKKTLKSDSIDGEKWLRGMTREELLEYFTENPDRNLFDTAVIFPTPLEGDALTESQFPPTSEPLSPVIK